MKWKDSFNMGKIKEELEQDSLDQEEYSSWKKGKFGTKLFKVPESPLVLMGIGLLALILLFVMFIPNSKNDADKKQIVELDTRIKLLEDRLAKLEGFGESVLRFGEQGKSLEQLKNRFDRLEESITLRMDHITKEIGDLQKKTVQVKSKITATPKSAKVIKKRTKKVYHIVRAGDTLYNISRSYGLKVDELLRLNKLAHGAVIYPGQKLLIGPAKGKE